LWAEASGNLLLQVLCAFWDQLPAALGEEFFRVRSQERRERSHLQHGFQPCCKCNELGRDGRYSTMTVKVEVAKEVGPALSGVLVAEMENW